MDMGPQFYGLASLVLQGYFEAIEAISEDFPQHRVLREDLHRQALVIINGLENEENS